MKWFWQKVFSCGSFLSCSTIRLMQWGVRGGLDCHVLPRRGTAIFGAHENEKMLKQWRLDNARVPYLNCQADF